jgi:hypothetical protein
MTGIAFTLGSPKLPAAANDLLSLDMKCILEKFA